MKMTALILLAAVVLPGSALAQSGAAAGTLPNTFDGDARTASPRTPARPSSAPASTPSGQTAAPGAADVARIAAVEAALRTTIAALQEGRPNYDAMTADVAAKMRTQSAELAPLIQSFGTLVAGRHQGAQDGAEVFGILFDNAATEWMIALNAQGKIAVLLFRPAPAPTTAPPATAPATD